jgi:hypothetical protein
VLFFFVFGGGFALFDYLLADFLGVAGDQTLIGIAIEHILALLIIY